MAEAKPVSKEEKKPELRFMEITHDFQIPRRGQHLTFQSGDLIEDQHLISYLEDVHRDVPKKPYQFLSKEEFEGRR